MPAAEFLKGPVPARGLVANPELARFAVTQFAAGEEPAAILARIGVGGADEVMVYRPKASRP